MLYILDYLYMYHKYILDIDGEVLVCGCSIPPWLMTEIGDWRPATALLLTPELRCARHRGSSVHQTRNLWRCSTSHCGQATLVRRDNFRTSKVEIITNN